MSQSKINADLSSYYASFRADDTLIDIIPAFDYHPPPNNNTTIFQSTIASCSFGPFKAGISHTVPLWMAIVLQQRSFATIVLPSWMSSSNLSSILQFEKSHSDLFRTTDIYMNTTVSLSLSQKKQHDTTTTFDDDDVEFDNVNHTDDDTQNNDERRRSETYLPSNYYEVAMRLTSSSSSSKGQQPMLSQSFSFSGNNNHHQNMIDTNHHSVIALLIQDLFDIRIDKLRQQFSLLVQETTSKLTNTTTTTNTNHHIMKMTDLAINVTGIGTQELAYIQSFVIQTMNDMYFLASSSSSSNRSTPSQSSSSLIGESLRTNNDDHHDNHNIDIETNDTNNNLSNQDQVSSSRPLIKRRLLGQK